MNKKNRVLAAIILSFAIFAAFFFFTPQLQNLGTITSWEVDRLLYERLDEYNRIVVETPDITNIFVAAETNPVELTEANRQIYVSYQRRFFFEGWKAAWDYHNAGILDDARWNKWNSWFIEEVRHRPQFGWTENRDHFSGEFLQHVDESVRDQ